MFRQREFAASKPNVSFRAVDSLNVIYIELSKDSVGSHFRS